MVIGRTVYFGCEDGNLYALSTDQRQRALGDRRSAARSSRRPPTTAARLYVGDYGGYMNAVDAKTGKLIWQSGSLGPGLRRLRRSSTRPPRSPSAASTPATTTPASTASTASDGTLAWSYSTGGYAYSGPAVANTRHSPPTVYIGSFDGNVYALDAKDGSLRWSRSAGGQVIGSLSAVGDIVYVAEFTNNTTTGFMMRSGQRGLPLPEAAPTRRSISDGRRIYLTGYSSITALQPFKPAERAAGAAEGAPRSALRRATARRQPAGRRRRQVRRARREGGEAAEWRRSLSTPRLAG